MSEKIKEREEINLDDYLSPESPQDWDVILYNDDRTPFEGVVAILNQVFDLSARDSFAIALVAHQQGKAIIIGGLPEDVAEGYIGQVNSLKEAYNLPNLLIQAEPSL